MRHLIAASVALALFGSAWLGTKFPWTADMVASVILAHKPKSVEYLQQKYDNVDSRKKIRVLIAPGHEPYYGGAEYGSVKERELVVDLSWELARFLSKNPKFEVILTRDSRNWNDDLFSYFEVKWNEIKEWKQLHKDATATLTSVGAFKPVSPGVVHIDVEEDVALRLYGINKWVNENDIDIVLHIHLNDYPGRPSYGPGEYSGFALYVPERQYNNSTTTKFLADSIYKRLELYNSPSDFPGEKGGIVEDQDLIAVGSFNSLDAASLLIEYGYLYEPQFVDAEMRQLAMKDLAYQTYLGLEDFLEGGEGSENAGAAKTAAANNYKTTVLPYRWTKLIEKKGTVDEDVFALQSVLEAEGLYPPEDVKRSECPRTGKFGVCTKESLKSFQEKYGIKGEYGVIGRKTIEVLNMKYGN